MPLPRAGDDVRTAARWLADEIERADAAALTAPAGAVSWSCWQTAEHVVDDLIAYALQVASGALLDYVPITGSRGDPEVVHVDPARGATGLGEALTASAELLATQVEAASGDLRAYHPYGISDPAGFAAMGVAEIVVHGYDILTGLGRPTQVPPGLSERVLDRLFPEAPAYAREAVAGGSTVDAGNASLPDADATLLWCTGRVKLPGRARLTRWRWDATVR